MYFEDLPSQCYATVTILANGIECREYNITSDEQGELHCYVNFQPQQTITIRVALDMTSECFDVDFLADGVIRNYWQSSRRSLNLRLAETFLIAEAIFRKENRLYRCPSTTMPLPAGAGSPAQPFPRADVGCISIIISKRDVERNTYFLDCKLPNQVADDADIRAFLEAAGVMSPAQNQLESMFIGNPASPLATSDTGDTQPASTTPANEGEELEALAARNLAGYEHLRVDAKQLQAQAEEARKHRVEVEASRDAIIEQARFECEQARLQHLIADEKAKAAVQKMIAAEEDVLYGDLTAWNGSNA